MQYKHQVYGHLADYKENTLKIPACGVFRKKEYKHILPRKLHQLNILEPFRQEFWKYAQETSFGSKSLYESLHQCFHHLNSSQAMCFNLFFPFVRHSEALNHLATLLLGPDSEAVANARFEHIEDLREGTNYDFFLELKSGRKLFFECKFTEADFGRAADDARHHRKLLEIYTPMLKNKVTPKALEPHTFFKNYQLLRNVSHLNVENNDHLFVVFPIGKSGVESPLVGKAEPFKELLLAHVKERVTVLPLEKLVQQISWSPLNDPKLKTHWVGFAEKYLPE